MRALLQRVKHASVSVDSDVVGKCGRGFLVLLGVGKGDSSADVSYLANKVVNMRVFADKDGSGADVHSIKSCFAEQNSDKDGKFNLSLKDVSGECLVVSQFTLYANTRGGNRPSFTDAAEPSLANKLYEEFCEVVSSLGVRVEKGVFGAMMDVALVNDGPVTVMVDSSK